MIRLRCIQLVVNNVKTTILHWFYIIKLTKLMIKLSPKEVIAILVITSCNGLIPLVAVISLQHMVNAISKLGSGVSTGTIDPIMFWTAIFIAGFVVQSAGRIYGNMLRDHVQERIKGKIQELVIRKAHRLPLEQFENPDLYDQLQRANSGLNSRLFSTISFLFQSVTNVITLISLLVYLMFIHWSIPIILFVGTAVFTLVKVRLFTEQYILHREQSTEMRKLHYVESLMTNRQSAAEIRLYNLRDHLRNKWKNLNQSLQSERLELAKREYKLEWISSSGNTLTFAVVLSGIVYIATLGLLSVGQYAAFIRSVIQFQEQLGMLFTDIAIINNDLMYIKDFFVYLDLNEETASGTSLQEGEGLNIACERISFNYPGSNQEVIKKLHFSIKPGEKVALVGNNGSGKTTLIKLLLGLYRPSSGTISINGIDMDDIEMTSWRKRCTAIFQDFQKYNLSIKENIAIGNIENVNEDERIKRAAVLSRSMDMIDDLPLQFDTYCGKEFDGIELSQGQWQKIAMARAYFRESDLLILDEPTASVDPKAEVEIYNQFKEAANGKTTIFISHRLGIARLADRIVVLDKGEIVEEGTHDQLMDDNGKYATMFRMQSQWYV
jgi:ATP-binding cassette, subfamily B, bacterial